jgi:molybdate transport system permease protein
MDLFPLRLSLQVAAISTGFTLVVGTFLGLLFARKEFRGKNLLDVLISLPIVFPPTVTGYYLIVLLGREGWLGRPLYHLTGWSLSFTWGAAVAASIIVSLPLMVKTSRSAIESVDPLYEKVSYSLGRSRWTTFFKIVLPLSQKGILAGVVLSFARAMGEFGATLMFAGNIPGKTNTLPLAIYSAFAAGDTHMAGMLVVLHSLICVGLLYMIQLLVGSKKVFF